MPLGLGVHLVRELDPLYSQPQELIHSLTNELLKFDHWSLKKNATGKVDIILGEALVL